MTLSSTSTGTSDGGIVDEPVFIVASERSGTTLMRLMLDGHPDLTWCHEFSYVVDLVGDDGSLPPLHSYYDHLDVDRVFQSAGFTVDETLDYTSLVNSFLLQRIESHGGTIVGANVHRHAHRLPTIWPNARYIHLVRDVRDVAASIVEQGWHGTHWHAADHWARAESGWDRLRETLTLENWMEVSFETLVADPATTMTTVCEFIGVPFKEEILDSYVGATDYEPVDPSRIQPWRTKLGRDDLGLVEARCAELLVSRGYELSGNPVPDLTAADLRRLERADRLGRIRARITVYGARLTLAEMTARLLGLRRSWRRQRRLMNAVVQRRIKKSW